MQNYIDKADVVIIGGGVVGVSAAWHLIEAGISDVLVLERNELASGATSRAAGLLDHGSGDANRIKMVTRTREDIVKLEETLGESVGFHQHGSVSAIFSEAHLQKMRTAEDAMRALSIGIHEIDRQEAKEHVPWLKSDAALRIIFVPEDGYLDGALLTAAYARAARKGGARIKRGIEVTGLLEDGGEVVGVATRSGEIRARWVVCAAGVWGISLASSFNFRLAGAPTRSHYWITAPDGNGPSDQPTVMLPDMQAYIRPEVGGLLVGLREPKSKTYDPGELDSDMGAMNLIDEAEDMDILIDQANALKPVVPGIDEWRFAHHIAGLTMYTPDGKFLLGRPKGSSGVIIAGGCCGSGLAASGGFGSVIAAIVTGQPTDIDTSIYDPNRFGPVDPYSLDFRERCAAARLRKGGGNPVLNA
ncbi:MULTISPECIES: NAD(P)/FAD-dependent oxidoreductase [Mesorhizobium]|uniref:FAD-binding oxidoreductase n=1 Tax=Mesorhizobium denitrificans TaxID=2294114 RepID=A0A371XJJ0_9HYPH|nr:MULTISPECIES: FAD-binding oxidoreductase [Mesorhizobium]RFC69396.1 FAD-binding oxidoreductase [Mesorhizobium denitrificans]